MGYACPVCETPQVDARHLANHVAFTALTGDDAHEDWLDEHVPEWGQLGEDELAEDVSEYAEERDVETVFEESGTQTPAPEPELREPPRAGLDDDAADVLAEAREYTRRMAGRSDGSDEDTDGTESDGAGQDETE